MTNGDKVKELLKEASQVDYDALARMLDSDMRPGAFLKLSLVELMLLNGIFRAFEGTETMTACLAILISPCCAKRFDTKEEKS
jgi:hypothetical protein